MAPHFAPASQSLQANPSSGLPQVTDAPSIRRTAPRPAGAVTPSNGPSVIASQPPHASHAATTPNASNQVIPASFSATRSTSIPFAPPEKTGKEKLGKPSSPWSATLSMIVSLMIVIGLFLIVARMLKSVAPGPQRILPKEVVQVLGRTPLAPRQSMVLVRFGRKLILVNQQLGQATPLGEIDNPSEVDHLLGLCEEQSATSISSSFRDVLMQLTDKATKPVAQRRNLRGDNTLDSNFDAAG